MTRIIELSVDPDKTSSYSVSLSKQSGTFSYSGIYESVPTFKQIQDIQGMPATVERVTPGSGPSNSGHTIEGRMLPMFQREYISVNYPEKDDGTPYYTSSIITDIAAKVGVSVAFSATNNLVKSFKFTGRFLDALNQLAQSSCGELIQQGGTWYVTAKGSAIGNFYVPVDDLISCEQSSQSDVLDQVVNTISSMRSVYDELYQIKKAKGSLEAELARLQNTEGQTGSAAVSALPLGPLSFEFGCGTSKRPTPVPNNIVIEGGTWDTFTPNAGESLNPDNPGKKYYQVRPVMSGGVATGAIQGCTCLIGATLLYPITEPSNASGKYYAKGLIFNLGMTGGGFGGSDNIQWVVTPEYRSVSQATETGTFIYVRQLYFGFTLPAGLIWGEDNTIDGDKRLYRVNLEISYRPAVVDKWRFTGTVEDGLWAVVKDDKFNGYINAQGLVYSLSGSTLPAVTDISLLDGILAPENVVKDSNGRLVGSIDEAGNVRNLGRELIGLFDPQTRAILYGTKATGFIPGGYSYTVWPGIQPAPPASNSFGFYAMEYMVYPLGTTPDGVEEAEETRLQNEIAKLQLDEDVANAKITCLTAELTRYNAAAIVPFIVAATDAWHAFYDTQEGQTSVLPQTTKDMIAQLETFAVQKDDELMTAISLIKAILVDITVSFLYNNIMPYPGQLLTIDGTLMGFSPNLVCGIIDSVSFNGYQITLRAQKNGSW